MSKKKKRGVPLPMDFSDALRQMREGLAVGRIAWCFKDGDAEVFKKTIRIEDRIINEYGISDISPGTKRTWRPTQEDILATDWSLCTVAVLA